MDMPYYILQVMRILIEVCVYGQGKKDIVYLIIHWYLL